MPACARVMPELAAMTGLRQGELLGLRLPNVDFLRREIRVVEQLLTPAAGPVAWGPPKTAAGVRSVPLTDEALEALAEHLATFPAVDGVVFRSPTGWLWRRQGFRDQWAPARDRAGLPVRAHWHGLRDVYASTLLRAGVDAQSLIAVMGHTSLAETKVYARLMPDSRDNVRASVAGAWSSRPRRATAGPENQR
jgi:integrase